MAICPPSYTTTNSGYVVPTTTTNTTTISSAPQTGQLRYNTGTGTAETWNGNAWIPITTGFQAQNKTDFKEGAWVPTISQLEDLWVTRFGSEWVSASIVDEFYRTAARRLGKLNKMEEASDGTDFYYRIVE